MGKKGEWKAVIDAIMMSLELVYSFPYPLSRKYVSKFLKGALADDRKIYKAYFIANKGEQHPDMPDEAYLVWSEWWSSPEGKIETEDMKALHAMRKSKRNSSAGDEASDPSTMNPAVNGNETPAHELDNLSNFTAAYQVIILLHARKST